MELLVPNTVTMASAKALQINKVQLPPRRGRKVQHAWTATAPKGPARRGVGGKQTGEGTQQACRPASWHWRCTGKCPLAVCMTSKTVSLGCSLPVDPDWVLPSEHPHGAWLHDAGQHQQAHQVGRNEEPQGAQSFEKVGGLADVGCDQGCDANRGH